MNSVKTPSLIAVCTLALLMPSASFAIDPEKKLDRLDRNDDGRISRAEHSAKAERRFAKMDADGNGVVTLAELREWRDDTPEDPKGRDGGKRHGRVFEDDQSPAEKFKVLDQNGDGRLTASEYAEACKKRFNELDNDNDGTLTGSEL